MAVHTKTRRRLQILLFGALALVLLGSGGYVLRKRQIAAQVLQGRDIGYAALEAGDHFTALHKIGPYLQRHPDDPDALHKYARARTEVEEPNGKHLADAMSLYRRLLELQPDNEAAREELLNLYVRVGFNAEILSRTSDRDDPVSLRTRAVALARTGQIRQALDAMRRYSDLRPLNLPMQVFTSELMMKDGGSASAVVERATQLQQKHPNDSKFELLLGTTYAMANDRAGALEWTRKAVARRVEDPELLDRAVELLDALGMHGEALAVLRQKAESRPELEFQRRLAQRLYQSGNWNDAAQRLASLDDKLAAADVELLGHRALSLLAMSDHDQAARVIQALRARTGERTAAAWADVLDVIPRKDAPPDDKRIVETCRAGLTTLPDNPYFHLHLGDAFARLGETELAVAAWREASVNAQAWPVPKARLVRLLIASRRPGLADAAEHLATLSANDADSLAIAAWARATAQPKPTAEQAEEMLKRVDAIQALRPGEPLSLRLKVHVLSQSDKDAARQLVQRYLAAQPPLPRDALLALASASEAATLDLEDACFDQCVKSHGNSVAVATARAAALVRAGKPDAAKRAFASTRANAADRDAAEWQLAWARLNEVVRDPAAPKIWSELAAARPDNPLVHLAIMTAESAQAERGSVRGAIDGIGGIIGNEGVTWRIADARWILQGAAARPTDAEREQDVVKAASILNELVHRHPDNAQARLLLGESLVRLGKKDAAVEHLTAAANAMPGSWGVSLQLASLLQSLGDFKSAKPYLERCEQLLEQASAAQATANEPLANESNNAQPAAAAAAQQPSVTASSNVANEAAWRTLAALYGAGGDTGRAVKILSRLSTTDDYTVDLALVELHRKAGTLTDDMCRKLLAHPTPTVIGVVADYYAASGHADDAKRAIAMLEGVKSEPGEREFIRGVYLQRIGAETEAIEQLRAACAAAPKNAQAWRALVSLLLSTRQPDDAVATAGRGLKEISDDPGLKRVVEQRDLLAATAEAAPARGLAVALVSDNVNAETTIAALRIVQTGLANKETTAQVASKLRPLADRAASFAALQNLLIDLYMSQRDFDSAWKIATRLAQLAPAEPAPAQRAAQALAAAGEWGQVIGAARDWRNRAGSRTREPDELLATAHLATRDFAAAERQLAPYLDEARRHPASSVQLYALYAQALVAQGRVDEARAFFESALAAGPAIREAWVTVAVRGIADLNVAGRWLDQVKPFMAGDSLDEPVLLASAWVQLVQRPGAGDAQRTAATTALADATAKAQSLANVTADHRVTLGALKEQMDDKPGAEADYRAALAIDSNQPIAQNNLAMLILRRDGDLNEAKDLATRAAKSTEHPAAPEFLETLAQVQRQLGLKAECADSFRKTVTLRPANLGYRASFVQALIDLNQTDEARTALTELERLAGQAASPDVQLRSTIERLRQLLDKLAAK